MLPPPAPTLEISTESALITRSCSRSNVLLTNGCPSTISETSVEVPPTSAQSRLPSPIASPSLALEIVPAAGPAKTILNGCSSASVQGSKVAAQSAKLRSPLEPELAQVAVEVVGVLREDALHEDVDDGCRRAGVLLRQRRRLGRDRDRDLAERVVDELSQPLLMARVDVRVEQADRDPFHVAAPEDVELLPHLHFVEAMHHAAVRQDPLADPAPEVPRHERPGRIAERATPARVGLPVERTPNATAVEHVAEPLGREERDLRQLPGDDGVEPHRARVVEDRAALDPEPSRALDHGRRGPVALTRDLRHLDATVADRDDVRERAADVYAEHVGLNSAVRAA